MLKIGKLTDYATIVLSTLADCGSAPTPARDLADRTGIGSATVAKLLKSLQRADLVESARGIRGGYQLAKSATQISAADIIEAIEGPVALTSCSQAHTSCDLESVCGMGPAWQQINTGIVNALRAISLDDMRNKRDIPIDIPLRPLNQSAVFSSAHASNSRREA
ncbi:MAG: SUF system Fe-S cluster assembly regulator [Pseudomonadota bacterium]